MGSPDFAVPSLKALCQAYEVVAVVTQPDRPAGRGRKNCACAVKQVAEELAIPVLPLASFRKADARRALADYEPELIVVAAYGALLPQEVLDLPKYGCVNVHASLLPRWRGAAPIQASMLAGDEWTGVSIMRMESGLDTGAVLSQARIPVATAANAGVLSDQLAELGAKCLLEALPAYLRGENTGMVQDDALATYAPKLTREDGLLNPEEDAALLLRKVRAYHPWPGVYLVVEGKRLKVLSAQLAEESRGARAGERRVIAGLPALGTAQGYLLLDRVQAEGRKAMDGASFLNGCSDWSN